MTARARLVRRVAWVTLLAAVAALCAFRYQAIAKLLDVSPVAEAKAGPKDDATPPAVRADGRLATYPNASAVIGTETGGTLVAFRVAEKQVVKRGELLAELDASEQRAALALARARIREADVSIEFLATELAKSERLLAAGAVPRQEVDRTRHQLDMAKAQRAVASASAAGLAAAEAKTKIRAPFDGVVLQRHAEERETVAPGARLVTIADLSRLRVEAEVDEFDAARLRPGAPVTITAEGHDRSWKGAVEDVPDLVARRRTKPDDPTRPTDTRVLLVKISLEDPAPLRLGQRVEVSIGR